MFRIGGRIAAGAPKVAVRAAQSIAAIHDEMRLHTRLGDGAVRDGVIDAVDVVRAELGRENTLRIGRAREYH